MKRIILLALLMMPIFAYAKESVVIPITKTPLTPKPIDTMICNPSTYAYMGGGVCQDTATGINYLGLAHHQ